MKFVLFTVPDNEDTKKEFYVNILTYTKMPILKELVKHLGRTKGIRIPKKKNSLEPTKIKIKTMDFTSRNKSLPTKCSEEEKITSNSKSGNFRSKKND